MHIDNAQAHTVLPVILVGCRHSVEGQRVRVHKVSPFTQVQLEQGPSGCQLDPSSYSTPSNTHATMRKEDLSFIHWWAAPACVFFRSMITFADWTAELWVSNRIGALNRRALLFTANNIPTLKKIHSTQFYMRQRQKQFSLCEWGLMQTCSLNCTCFWQTSSNTLRTCLTPALKAGSTSIRYEHFSVSKYSPVILTFWGNKFKPIMFAWV